MLLDAFLLFLFFFFFKQKTAYEMRISDWSSDVCSSDLYAHRARRAAQILARRLHPGAQGWWCRRQRLWERPGRHGNCGHQSDGDEAANPGARLDRKSVV